MNVSTEQELRDALRDMQPEITIIESFEFKETIEVGYPLDLKCAPRVLIQFLSYSEQNVPAILVTSTGVEFYKFAIIGGGKNLYDKETDGLQTGIKFSCDGVGSCVRCAVGGFNYAGIWAFDVNILNVTQSGFVGTSATYYNYGVWQGGRGNAKDQVLNFVSNEVTGVRHAVGASGHPNSYYAVNNLIHSTIKQAFDRHSGDTPKVGGMHTHIVGNTFLNPDRYAFSINEPYKGGSVLFSGNRLKRSGSKPVGEKSGVPMNEGFETDNIKVFANQYEI